MDSYFVTPKEDRYGILSHCTCMQDHGAHMPWESGVQRWILAFQTL